MLHPRTVKHIAAALLCLSCTLMADNPDDKKDLSISSDQLEYREKDGIATYTGNVEAIQGSRKLHGDKLEVYRGKNNDIEKIIVFGKPATYEAITDPKKPLFEAEAKVITYLTAKSFLTLNGDARVHQGGDAYAAPLIEYDATQKIVRSPESKKGRTTIIVKPRE